MEIKKVKSALIYVNDEKEITSKKNGKKYKLCEVNIKIADDSKELAGNYVKITIFGYEDPKNPSKNKSATEKANYFKVMNEGKEFFLQVEEREYVNKEGKTVKAYTGKPLSKKETELANKLYK